MSRRQARFEIVRTAAGWHARFRAANGQVVWTTEVYTRRRAALAAVCSLIDPLNSYEGDGAYLNGKWHEVREVDER